MDVYECLSIIFGVGFAGLLAWFYRHEVDAVSEDDSNKCVSNRREVNQPIDFPCRRKKVQRQGTDNAPDEDDESLGI